MVQRPAVTIVRLLPLTVQTAGVIDVNDTAKPDEALALNTIGTRLKVCAPGLLKLIELLGFSTVSVNNCIALPIPLLAVNVTG